MKKVYENYSGKEIKTSSYQGVVAGYSEDKVILAVEGNPIPSFKRLDKDSWVEDQWRSGNHRFVYSDEAAIEKYLGVKGIYGV